MELSSADSSTEREPNLFVLAEPSLLHHTFLLAPASFTALPLSALTLVLPRARAGAPMTTWSVIRDVIQSKILLALQNRSRTYDSFNRSLQLSKCRTSLDLEAYRRKAFCVSQ